MIDNRTQIPSYAPAYPVQERDTRVLAARLWAFVIDFVVITSLTVVLWLLVAMAGILTLGLSWLALPLVAPFTAFFYNALTVSGPRRATWGMRAMDLEVTTLEGNGLDFIGAGAHALFFWLSMYVTSGFAVLFGLFHPQSRQLHDIVTRVIVTRRAA